MTADRRLIYSRLDGKAMQILLPGIETDLVYRYRQVLVA